MDLQNLTRSPEEAAALEAEIAATLWSRGDLSYKLDTTQLRVRAARAAAWAPPELVKITDFLTEAEKVRRAAVPISFFELLARGNGKSFELVVLACETAIQTPNQRILYCAPLKEDAEKIAKDLLELNILIDCPKESQPTWKDGECHFKNGSIIRFRGVNNESDGRLRGAGYHLVILDEVAFYDRLRKVMRVVKPIAKRFKGKIILATTPSEQADHESTTLYEEHALVVPGRPPTAIKLTMLDNPRWTWEERVQILNDNREALEDIPAILAGTMLPKQTETLREYWVEFLTDDQTARFPKFRDEERQIVFEWSEAKPRPAFFFPYSVFDLGFIDRTGGLFGGHDYENDVIFVEDEALLIRPSSREIADVTHAKEQEHFAGNPHAPTRIMDAAPFVLEDIRREHHLDFQPPDKSGVQSGISYVQGSNNYVNLLISGRQIKVHKRCVNLLRQMRNAIWNKKRNDFERDSRDGPESMGHYDLAAALVYFCRAILRTRNPFPEGHRIQRDTASTWRKPEAPNTGVLPQSAWGRKIAAHWKSRGAR